MTSKLRKSNIKVEKRLRRNAPQAKVLRNSRKLRSSYSRLWYHDTHFVFFYNWAILCDSCSYLSSLLFLISKTEFVSSFALLCSPFPSADWPLLDCAIDRKVRYIIFGAILSLSELYQKVRIILNIIAFFHSG